MIYTPSNLELLLHCHYSPVPHPRFHAPAIQDGIAYLAKHHMIEPSSEDNVWQTTDKGKFYINFLMAVPFPLTVWSIKVSEQTVLLPEGD